MTNTKTTRNSGLGTWHVMVSGVALVVAASTLVSEFTGYFTLGIAFVAALALGFSVNLSLGLCASDLSVAYPRAGALYDYARAIFRGTFGRAVSVVLGLSFFGMFAFAASGETAAGAFGLQALTGLNLPIGMFIVALAILAVIPNLFGLKTTAWVSAGLLLFMLGIRWLFGLAGFFGLSRTGSWSMANLVSGEGGVTLMGEGGILTAGLAIALWSFVGIEFACGLAEEAREPRKAMPRGLLLGLGGILLTSWVMGLGVTGTQPLTEWQTLAAGEIGAGGEAPQLAVGYAMFGTSGYVLMALASFSATLGTLTVAYAVMPRILFSIARDGNLGRASGWFAKTHPHFGTPINATLFALPMYVLPALASSQVIDWVYSAAYLWMLLYAVFHVLAIASRVRHPRVERAFRGGWFVPTVVVGLVLTLGSLYVAFAGAHAHYGLRALMVVALAGAATAASMVPARRKPLHAARMTGRADGQDARPTLPGLPSNVLRESV